MCLVCLQRRRPPGGHGQDYTNSQYSNKNSRNVSNNHDTDLGLPVINPRGADSDSDDDDYYDNLQNNGYYGRRQNRNNGSYDNYSSTVHNGRRGDSSIYGNQSRSQREAGHARNGVQNRGDYLDRPSSPKRKIEFVDSGNKLIDDWVDFDNALDRVSPVQQNANVNMPRIQDKYLKNKYGAKQNKDERPYRTQEKDMDYIIPDRRNTEYVGPKQKNICRDHGEPSHNILPEHVAKSENRRRIPQQHDEDMAPEVNQNNALSLQPGPSSRPKYQGNQGSQHTGSYYPKHGANNDTKHERNYGSKQGENYGPEEDVCLNPTHVLKGNQYQKGNMKQIETKTNHSHEPHQQFKSEQKGSQQNPDGKVESKHRSSRGNPVKHTDEEEEFGYYDKDDIGYYGNPENIKNNWDGINADPSMLSRTVSGSKLGDVDQTLIRSADGISHASSVSLTSLKHSPQRQPADHRRGSGQMERHKEKVNKGCKNKTNQGNYQYWDRKEPQNTMSVSQPVNDKASQPMNDRAFEIDISLQFEEVITW